MITVLVVDDQPLIRLGTAMLLGAADDIRVVGEAANGADAVERTLALVPDVVVMDVRMPGMDGVEATKHIVAAGVQSAVLVLTTFDVDEYAFGAINAGASGFLLKDAPPDELLHAIRIVAAGDAIVSPRVTKRLLELHRGGRPARVRANDPRIADLTDRERAVFEAIGRGLSNTEISAELFLAESTVKTHVGRVLAKSGARDRIHAVLIAIELGLA